MRLVVVRRNQKASAYCAKFAEKVRNFTAVIGNHQTLRYHRCCIALVNNKMHDMTSKSDCMHGWHELHASGHSLLTWKAGRALRFKICVQDLSVSHCEAGFGVAATGPRVTPDSKKRHSTASKDTELAPNVA